MSTDIYRKVEFQQVFFNIFLRFGRRSKQEGDTALLWAASPMIPPRTRPALLHYVKPSILNALLNAGANPNCRDRFNDTPLHFAVDACPSQVQHLLYKGADVNVKDDEGSTPLMQAAMYNCRCIPLLLDKGAHINTQDTHGNTALMCAADWGNAEAVKILLARHANTTIKDRYGYTALSAAEPKILHMLKQAGAKE